MPAVATSTLRCSTVMTIDAASDAHNSCCALGRSRAVGCNKSSSMRLLFPTRCLELIDNPMHKIINVLGSNLVKDKAEEEELKALRVATWNVGAMVEEHD